MQLHSEIFNYCSCRYIKRFVYHVGDLSQILLEGNCNHIQLETRELTLEHTVIYATAI